MNVDFSKDFAKSVRRLSGKILQSVIAMIDEVRDAQSIEQISNCKKIEALNNVYLNNVYRIRIGDRRAFFVLHIQIEGDLVMFEYVFNRGEAYDKKNMQKLRNKDC